MRWRFAIRQISWKSHWGRAKSKSRERALAVRQAITIPTSPRG
jgi:hypothetical protein